MSRLNSSTSALAALRIERLSSVPRAVFSSPRKMFSVTVRLGSSDSSWYTVEMPSFSASCGAENLTSSPSRTIAPESGWMAPLRHFSMVDFPAPLWPTRPMTSPGRRETDTPLSTGVPEYDLTSPVARHSVVDMSISLRCYRSAQPSSLLAGVSPLRNILRGWSTSFSTFPPPSQFLISPITSWPYFSGSWATHAGYTSVRVSPSAQKP